MVSPVTEPPRLRVARFVCSPLQPFGAGKIARSLYPYELGKRDNLQFSVRAKTGSKFSGSTADFHAHPFAIYGCSEWRNWAIALAVCRPGDALVEIGANVGTETVGFSDIVGAAGRVLAFEPLPANVTTLERVLDGLRHPNVKLMPHALSDREGYETFAVPPAAMSQGIGHLLGPGESQAGATSYHDEPVPMQVIQVPTMPLDDFSAELHGLRLLVADAEGSELKILRGANQVLSDQRPALVLEASPAHQRRAGFSIAELHDELLSLNYAVYNIGLLRLTEVRDPDAEGGDWFCAPAESEALVARVQRCLRRCALSPCVLGLNPLTSPRRG